MPMLQVQNLSFGYHNSSFLFDDFSMEFTPGHIHGLLGVNGVGKSTLLYLMAGLLTPQAGQVTFKGVNVRKRLPITMSDIFMVPDEYRLPKVTLSQYIRTNSVFYPRFSEADMKQYLQVFGMTDDVRLGELSLGQGKKVFMSFAMATHTQVLLMDEPTNGLDIPGKAQFREFLQAGRTDDSIFVVSTHQVKDVEQILGHVLLLERNKVLIDADAQDISVDGQLDLETFFNEHVNSQGKEEQL